MPLAFTDADTKAEVVMFLSPPRRAKSPAAAEEKRPSSATRDGERMAFVGSERSEGGV